MISQPRIPPSQADAQTNQSTTQQTEPTIQYCFQRLVALLGDFYHHQSKPVSVGIYDLLLHICTNAPRDELPGMLVVLHEKGLDLALAKGLDGPTDVPLYTTHRMMEALKHNTLRCPIALHRFVCRLSQRFILGEGTSRERWIAMTMIKEMLKYDCLIDIAALGDLLCEGMAVALIKMVETDQEMRILCISLLCEVGNRLRRDCPSAMELFLSRISCSESAVEVMRTTLSGSSMEIVEWIDTRDQGVW